MKSGIALIATLFSLQAVAQSNFSPLNSITINYDWMNKVVNQTPAQKSSCPNIAVDLYRDGFSIARETLYYAGLNASMSRWFSDLSLWASVGVGPVKDGFGIYFTTARDWSGVTTAKEKKLPMTAREISKWKVTDGAYWESFGGVSLYLGAGISPLHAGAFAVVKGGWTNYLQKTGPQTVYVERAKTKIKSVSFGAGVSHPSIAHERVAQAASGFSYEFVLDNPESIEAFERFMVGDTTKAQELGQIEGSGVLKIADSSQLKNGYTNSIGFQTPFIPLISLRASTERSYDLFEEVSSWDEKTERNHGIYIKQRRSRLFDKHFRESRSFKGGITVKDFPDYSTGGRKVTDTTFGAFTYHYESDWGQENRINKYIKRAGEYTGLTAETCARVGEFNNTLHYNQVRLEVKWSPDYVKAILGLKGSNTGLFNDVKNMALRYNQALAAKSICDEEDFRDNSAACQKARPENIANSIETLKAIASKLKTYYQTANNEEFARHSAKFAEVIWKSPALFQAFYQKGKSCGQDFTYEVSGMRLAKHLVEKKFKYSASCL